MIHTADKVHFHKFIHSNILLSNTKISFQNILTRNRCNAMPEFKVFSGNAKGFSSLSLSQSQQTDLDRRTSGSI